MSHVNLPRRFNQSETKRLRQSLNDKCKVLESQNELRAPYSDQVMLNLTTELDQSENGGENMFTKEKMINSASDYSIEPNIKLNFKPGQDTAIHTYFKIK